MSRYQTTGKLRISYLADVIIGNSSKKRIDIGTFWNNHQCFRCQHFSCEHQYSLFMCGCTPSLEILRIKDNPIPKEPSILYIQTECKDFLASEEERMWRIHSPWANRFPRKYKMDLYL